MTQQTRRLILRPTALMMCIGLFVCPYRASVLLDSESPRNFKRVQTQIPTGLSGGLEETYEVSVQRSRRRQETIIVKINFVHSLMVESDGELR